MTETEKQKNQREQREVKEIDAAIEANYAKTPPDQRAKNGKEREGR